MSALFDVEAQLLMTCRAIKVNLANEGTEQRMKEAEVMQRKRKAEDDVKWEGATTSLTFS